MFYEYKKIKVECDICQRSETMHICVSVLNKLDEIDNAIVKGLPYNWEYYKAPPFNFMKLRCEVCKNNGKV